MEYINISLYRASTPERACSQANYDDSAWMGKIDLKIYKKKSKQGEAPDKKVVLCWIE